MSWTSIHIFHADQDDLLIDAVHPLVNRLREAGEIEKYFFVRYWNGGPHVRLRLCPNGLDLSGTESYRELFEFFQNNSSPQYSPEDYRAEVARMDRLEGQLATLIDDPQHHTEVCEPLQRAPSVQTRLYRFDTVRYGDDIARTIAEEHFFRSSELAFEVITQTRNRKVARLTVALHLAAAVATVILTPGTDCPTLFEQASQGLRLVYPELGEEPFKTLNFPSFESERDQLSDLLFQLRQDGPLPGQGEIVNRWIRIWRDEIAECRRRLQEQEAAQVLAVEPEFLLMDYLHMMNNRLGIDVRSECYNYYLVSSALQEIRRNERELR